jgi:hypothetical protein
MNTIPEEYIIIDNRNSNDLKGITISGYKRSDVYKTYLNSMINGKLEDSIRWCVELHASGLNKAIWENLYHIYSRYIHVNNPKYLFYFLKREKDYFQAIHKYSKKHEYYSRNDQEIRNLYAELTSISTLTKKNNIFLTKSLPNINHHSFEQENIAKRIISKNYDKILFYINEHMTNQMKLALNEIICNLSSKKGTFQNCIYWYLWLEKFIKKDEEPIKINNIFEDHWIFVLWKIILSFKNNVYKNDGSMIKKLYQFYKKDFKLSQMNKKKYYIFICFYILKNNINWNIPIFTNEVLIIQSNANINKMYQNIKLNIESKLSKEAKYHLYNEYYSSQINDNDIKEPVKIKDTYLHEYINKTYLHLNKIEHTKYPQYEIISAKNKNNVEQNIEQNIEPNLEEIIDDNLISKNMTLKDIEDEKKVLQDKKLNAFVNFIFYKKNDNNTKDTKDNINTNDNHTEDSNKNEIKDINFNKKRG